MSFIEYLYNLENGSVCVRPLYGNKIKNRSQFPDTLAMELNNILQTYGGIDNKFIVLVDLTKINMNSEHATNNIFFYKKLKDRLERDFPDKLDKIIIYDYTEKTNFLLNIIKLILDKDLRKKIIVDRKYKEFVNDKIVNKSNLNNNERHY